MQAARSAFLNQDRTVRRKLQETFVTYRLEREFTKQEILALYLNVIFFGQRAYGVAAAAGTPARASGATSSRSAKPRRWRACLNGRLATTRYPIRRAPPSAASTCC